jgi:hypothetical protein
LRRFKGILLPVLLLLLAVSFKATQAQTPEEDASVDVPAEPESEGDSGYRVKIADPFIELHTGPGGGYPIYYVIDRGVEVRILRRKTDWYKLVTDDGKTGWASREQMQRTLLPSGEQFQLIEVDREDFLQRRWMLGVTGGEFEAAPVFTMFAAYSFSENLAAEVHFGKSVGDKSSATYIKGNMIMQPWADLKYSPYFSLGLGQIEVDPSATLIAVPDEDNSFAQVGIGVQRHLSRNFLARFEYNEYVIFSASSIRDNNEEVKEWKFGFAVFF